MCVDPPSTTPAEVGYVYDSADRLVSTSDTRVGRWVNDPLGRMTSFAASGGQAAGGRGEHVLYDNGLGSVAVQTRNRVAPCGLSRNATA